MEIAANNVMKKKTSGRQKIKIEKIKKKENLQVSFSKRRTGLFKKAAELSILSGADVAVLSTSPAGKKVYAFGSPSPDYVFERFLSPYQNPHERVNLSIGQLQLLIEQNKKLDEERDAAEAGERIGAHWWEEDVSELGLDELVKFTTALEVFRSNVLNKAQQMADTKQSIF